MQQQSWHALALVRTSSALFRCVNLKSVCAVLQLIASIACVRALWISRRKSGSRLTNYLILHTFALWIVNLIGLVTAALAFQWLFGSTTQRIMDTESWSQRLCLPDSSEVLRVYAEDQILLETAGLLARFRKLALISNLAFAISGILTDTMLVS